MLPQAPLQAWLAARLPDWPAHWQVRRITGGQSNPTWLIEAGDGGTATTGCPGESADAPVHGRAWVLRARPGPAARLLPGAHAIEREYRVLAALQGSAVPVPAVRALCEDESVIGAAFYLMDFVPGRVLRDTRLPGWAPAERSALHAHAVEVLAALHRVDWAACGLGGYGRAEAYFDRLVARWSRQYREAVQASQPAVAAMDHLTKALPHHIPSGAAAWPAVLTHGDYRLENLMVDGQAPQIRAVLDWELSTLGHPLGDLGYHAMAWHLPEGPLRGLGAAQGLPEGIPPLPTMLARYADHLGPAQGPALRQALDEDWPFYLGVQLFRLAAILHGIGHRQAQGLAAHPQAAEMGRQAEPVAELAWAVLQG